MAASTTDTTDTTSPVTQPATSAAMRIAPRAVPIPITPAVATRRATTDSNPAVDVDNMGPGVANLLGIYQAVADF